MDMPHMETEGLKAFARYIDKSEVFLEYGAGGSTGFAARTTGVKAIISAESDAAWVERVKSDLAQMEPQAEIHVDHYNIGPVGDWGMPVDTSGFKTYHSYITGPWRKAAARGFTPDLVLIDGRFRVSCFLYTLLKARPGTPILFDDYMDRERYFVAEAFCPRLAAHGRMAVFEAGPVEDVGKLVEQLLRFSVLPEM